MSVISIEVSADYARGLTDKIKIAVEGAWQLIAEAYQSRAWSALGYANWDDYCTREFGTSRLKLPREDRTERVASLRDSGLSIRAIASATGISDQTVQRDLRSGVVNHYTSPETITPVRGMDGKTYTRPEVTEAPAPKRRPITDQAQDASWELLRAAEKLQRVFADDRFGRHQSAISTHIKGNLNNSLTILNSLADNL